MAVLAALDSLETRSLSTLRLAIGPAAPIAHTAGCILAITSASPGYTDKDRFEVAVLPPYVTHDVNRVETTITSLGMFGFAMAPGVAPRGVGFRYDGGDNLLYEGALMIGTSATRISDAARTTSAVSDFDFATTAGGVPHLQQPGAWAPQQTRSSFTDAAAGAPLPVAVQQESYAYTGPVHDDYVILRYWIRNTGAAAIAGLRAQPCDVTDEAAVQALFASLPPQEILVNSAGAAASAPFARMSLAHLRQMLDVNLVSAFLCSRAALPAMLEGGFGRIVTVASTAGLKGYGYVAAYCAAKHAAVVKSPRCLRASFFKRYSGEGGHASTGSSLK